MADFASWFIGLRYSGTRGNSLFLSFISLISLMGVTLGVVALTIVVSVMNGFDSELKRRILGAVPHVVVDTRADLPSLMGTDPRIRGIAPFMRRQGLLVSGDSSQLIAVYGVVPDKESRMSAIPAHMEDGVLAELTPGSRGVVMGRELGFRAGIGRGDYVTLVIPEPSAGGETIVPRIARVQVKGFFELGSELDYRLLLTNIRDLEAITGSHETSYRLTLDDVFQAGAVSRSVKERLGASTPVSDWTREYGDFFRTVRMEKIMMFVLLSLVIAIAAFNIISGLSMMVKEKQGDIAVLRTLGMSPGRIMSIFVIQGGLIGALGTVLGVALGVPLAARIPEIVGFFEKLAGARMLAGTYFQRVPSDVRLPDVAAILVVSLTMTLLATLYPAWRAARLRPAEVLHSDV